MSGDAATDCSDASGTLWLDVAQRAWSPAMLAACGLDEAAMPRALRGQRGDGSAARRGRERVGRRARVRSRRAPAITRRAPPARAWWRAGDASLSLGTSGVLFVAGDRFRPNPGRAVHAFCHCLPGRWHQMSVLLSRRELSRLGDATHRRGGRGRAARRGGGRGSTGGGRAALPPLPLGRAHAAQRSRRARRLLRALPRHRPRRRWPAPCWRGSPSPSPTRSRRCSKRAPPRARSRWSAAARAARSGCGSSRRCSTRRSRSAPARDVGPALGAARLARLAVSGERAEEVCKAPPLARVIEPDPRLRDHYRAPLERFRAPLSSAARRLRRRRSEEIRDDPFPRRRPHPLRGSGRRESARVPLVRPRSRRARQAHGGARALRRLLLAHASAGPAPTSSAPAPSSARGSPRTATRWRWPRRRSTPRSSSSTSSARRSSASTIATSRRKARRCARATRSSTACSNASRSRWRAPGRACCGAPRTSSAIRATPPARRPTPIPRCSPTPPRR